MKYQLTTDLPASARGVSGEARGIDADVLNDLSPYVRRIEVHSTSGVECKFIDSDNVILYAIGGSAELYVMGRKWTVRPGSLLIIPPNTLHVYRDVSVPTICEFVCSFDLRYAPERSKLAESERFRTFDQMDEREMFFQDHVCALMLSASEQRWFEDRFEHMRHDFEMKQWGWALAVKADLLEILSYLIRRMICAPEYGSDPVSLSWQWVRKAVLYLQTNYTNSLLRNDDVAAAVGITPNYLSNIFSQKFGTTIQKYVTSLRIGAAKRLIEEEMPFSQVAEMVGFASFQSFCKVFKRETGMTASEYRTRCVDIK